MLNANQRISSAQLQHNNADKMHRLESTSESAPSSVAHGRFAGRFSLVITIGYRSPRLTRRSGPLQGPHYPSGEYRTQSLWDSPQLCASECREDRASV